MGSVLHYSLTSDDSDADVDRRIASATTTSGALKNIFLIRGRRLLVIDLTGRRQRYLSEGLKGEVYEALVSPTFRYGCEAWSSLREDLFKRLFRRLNLRHQQPLAQSDSPLGWPRCSYAHEPGATAVTNQLSSTFLAGRLPTVDVG